MRPIGTQPACLVHGVWLDRRPCKRSPSTDALIRPSVALNPRGDMGFGFAWLHASTGDIEGRTASGQRTGSVSDVSNAFLVATGRSLETS